MAEVVGFLREDATHGEKETLKYLRHNLPKEFTVYVETPIHKKREIRYPDFIVLTGYGVIVLEVKDWVQVTHADPDGATVRTRKGETRHEPNPVTKAREFAIVLSTELNKKRHGNGAGESIPWSYAAVLSNLPYSVITQLRNPWGEEFVLGEDDLIVPDLLKNRLKMTFPVERMRSLTRMELDLIRATVYPVVEIEIPGRPAFVLDETQEKIVAEPVRPEPPARVKPKDDEHRQDELFESIKTPEPEKEEEALPSEGDRIVSNTAIRLVRGFAGSGKSLVLIQRAKFLAAQYPDWKIGVCTYNKQLQEEFVTAFEGTPVRPRTFHNLCWSLLPQQGDAVDIEKWLDANKFDFGIIRKISSASVKMELDWMHDMGISERESYLKVERRGIGKDLRLSAEQRAQMFDVYEAYHAYRAENKLWDWESLPMLVDQELSAGRITPETYDAILIDEAQDWAPNWIRVINRMVNPESGMIFLADDPSQSIFRNFSWKEKGMHVSGRTRWLKVPYRNTQEIYQAAYGMIADHAAIQASLSDEGELVKPDLLSAPMRHGARPLVQKCGSLEKELEFIKERIVMLHQEGYRDDQIVILTRYKNTINTIQNAMKGFNVGIHVIHGYKGLEKEVVFIPHLQKTFQKEDEEYITAERRILYMAMSRAREQLFMTYFGALPRPYEDLRKNSLADFVG